TSPCASQIITALASRAYRRPVTPGEADKLARLAEAVRGNGDSFEESIRVALQAMLMSPGFLLRVEQDVAGQGAVPVAPYDLASRLSYFLWSSMPDDSLLHAAGDGSLRNPQVFEAQVR